MDFWQTVALMGQMISINQGSPGGGREGDGKGGGGTHRADTETPGALKPSHKAQPKEIILSIS